jgi:hypothetical protein
MIVCWDVLLRIKKTFNNRQRPCFRKFASRDFRALPTGSVRPIFPFQESLKKVLDLWVESSRSFASKF